jgi:hypothetical protein
VTFADLHDELAAAGLHVGVELQGAGHAITIDDGASRRIALAVRGGFDRTARVLVASMRLREALAPLPELSAPGREVRGHWPEFALLDALGYGPEHG